MKENRIVDTPQLPVSDLFRSMFLIWMPYLFSRGQQFYNEGAILRVVCSGEGRWGGDDKGCGGGSREGDGWQEGRQGRRRESVFLPMRWREWERRIRQGRSITWMKLFPSLSLGSRVWGWGGRHDWVPVQLIVQCTHSMWHHTALWGELCLFWQNEVRVVQ